MEQALSQAQGLPLGVLFMTFPRDPPHTSFPSYGQECSHSILRGCRTSASHWNEADPSTPKTAPEMAQR